MSTLSFEPTSLTLVTEGQIPEIDADTIFCCGMFRSGSTVLYQAVSGIVEMRGVGRRNGYYEPHIDGHGGASLLLDAFPAPGAVYKLPWLGDTEERLIRDGAHAFYSYRDLDESLDSLFATFAIPSEYWSIWRKLAEGHRQRMEAVTGRNLHRIPFRRIAEDLPGVVRRLAAWLPGDGDPVSLAADLSLENQKHRTKKTRARQLPMDSWTLLLPRHFREDT